MIGESDESENDISDSDNRQLLVLSACSPDVTEDLLETSVSPKGTHTVQAYRVSAGATVDFSVKCYLIDNEKKYEIYNQYHQSTVDTNP